MSLLSITQHILIVSQLYYNIVIHYLFVYVYNNILWILDRFPPYVLNTHYTHFVRLPDNFLTVVAKATTGFVRKNTAKSYVYLYYIL